MNYARRKNYQKEYTEIKYLNNKWRNRIFNVKNSPLELAKDFNSIKASIGHLDKFKEKEITKKRAF